MKTVLVNEVYVEDLFDLFLTLKEKSFDAVNVARDHNGTYVFLTDAEDKDPQAIVIECAQKISKKLTQKQHLDIARRTHNVEQQKLKSDQVEAVESEQTKTEMEVNPKEGFFKKLWKKLSGNVVEEKEIPVLQVVEDLNPTPVMELEATEEVRPTPKKDVIFMVVPSKKKKEANPFQDQVEEFEAGQEKINPS